MSDAADTVRATLEHTLKTSGYLPERRNAEVALSALARLEAVRAAAVRLFVAMDSPLTHNPEAVLHQRSVSQERLRAALAACEAAE